MTGLLRRDLENARRNLAAWRNEPDSPFVRERLAYWVTEIDELLDQLLEARRV